LLALPKEVRDDVIRRRISPSVAQELVSLGDGEADEFVEIIRERHLSMREVRRIVRRHHSGGLGTGGELSACDLDARAPDQAEIRAQIADRAIARAVASMRVDSYRLGEVIDDVADQWVLAETLLPCRAILNEQIDTLLRFRKKLLRDSARH